jgi:hypothetical protein
MVLIPFLIRLRALPRSTLEFALGLEPIVQLKAWLSTAFEIKLVCTKSDFFVKRQRSLAKSLPSPPEWRRLGALHFQFS